MAIDASVTGAATAVEASSPWSQAPQVWTDFPNLSRFGGTSRNLRCDDRCVCGAHASGSIDVRQLFFPYLSSAAAIAFLGSLSFIFIEFAKLARVRADSPIGIVKRKLFDRAPLIILPALVLPAFLIGYTASKSAIQFLVGYTWDAFWANADRWIFGDDVWHPTWRILGTSYSPLWEWLYTVAWGGAFFIVANAVTLFASKRFVGVSFSAMLATWLVGGCFMAYCFSAAGPVFAPLFDPNLTAQFEPLRMALGGSLGHGPIGFTQQYLAKLVNVHVAVKGGGISAMPSMHLASTSIYVLAAAGNKMAASGHIVLADYFCGLRLLRLSLLGRRHRCRLCLGCLLVCGRTYFPSTAPGPVWIADIS